MGLEAERPEPVRAKSKEEGTVSDLTIPSAHWASLADSGAPFQPGQGPGPWAASRCSALLWAAPSLLPWGMSLLTCYEGLRHQIERLVRENEELKKLVRLIRENQELKSAIKTQAGGLCISGFTSGLGEAATGHSQHQGNYKRPGYKERGDGRMGLVREEEAVCRGPRKLWREGLHSKKQRTLASTGGGRMRTQDHCMKGQNEAPRLLIR